MLVELEHLSPKDTSLCRNKRNLATCIHSVSLAVAISSIMYVTPIHLLQFTSLPGVSGASSSTNSDSFHHQSQRDDGVISGRTSTGGRSMTGGYLNNGPGPGDRFGSSNDFIDDSLFDGRSVGSGSRGWGSASRESGGALSPGGFEVAPHRQDVEHVRLVMELIDAVRENDVGTVADILQGMPDPSAMLGAVHPGTCATPVEFMHCRLGTETGE